MTAMSYIVFDVGGIDVPVIFPGTLSHDLVRLKFGSYSPVSAGKVSLKGTLHCHGKSTSLDMAAREEADSKILNSWFSLDV